MARLLAIGCAICGITAAISVPLLVNSTPSSTTGLQHVCKPGSVCTPEPVSPAAIKRIAHYLGTDRPVYVQWGSFYPLNTAIGRSAFKSYAKAIGPSRLKSFFRQIEQMAQDAGLSGSTEFKSFIRQATQMANAEGLSLWANQP